MDIPNGGPAFPVFPDGHNPCAGMTLLDWFAGQALIGLVDELKKKPRHLTGMAIASDCYDMAQLMIEERTKRGIE